MPTGYTASVQDGSISTFPEFAMLCARAFGAAIMMRDDPLDKPIPDEFQPQTEYYEKQITVAEERLAWLRSLSPADADREARREFEEAVSRRREREAERQTFRQRYEAMLDQVEAWQPPTEEHVEMKAFMSQQLRESIAFDTRPLGAKYDPEPVLQHGAEWRAANEAACHQSIARAEDQIAEEINRTNGRNRWVRELRTSLAKGGDA